MSVSRDAAERGQRGPEDPYLNTKHLFYSTTWGDQGDPGDGNDWDETDLTGSGRTSAKTVEFDISDNRLVEIHGFKVDVGDPVEGTGKFDVWMFDGPKTGLFWQDVYSGKDSDRVLWHHSTNTEQGVDVNNHGMSESQVWFPKPILNAGEVEVVFREGLNDVGEVAGRMYYTVREFEEDAVIREIMENRL
jgi:hypothetical protein